jgi:hypothetical protein
MDHKTRRAEFWPWDLSDIDISDKAKSAGYLLPVSDASCRGSLGRERHDHKGYHGFADFGDLLNLSICGQFARIYCYAMEISVPRVPSITAKLQACIFVRHFGHSAPATRPAIGLPLPHAGRTWPPVMNRGVSPAPGPDSAGQRAGGRSGCRGPEDNAVCNWITHGLVPKL